MKNKIPRSMTLPLSLSRIWGKKFKKFKKGRKKGKEIRNVLNFTYRVHKRLCFLLPDKRPPHFLSLPYANPNLNPTHRGENRLTKSLQTCHHHVEQLPASQNSKYPSLFQTNPRIIVHIHIYTHIHDRFEKFEIRLRGEETDLWSIVLGNNWGRRGQ